MDRRNTVRAWGTAWLLCLAQVGCSAGGAQVDGAGDVMTVDRSSVTDAETGGPDVPPVPELGRPDGATSIAEAMRCGPLPAAQGEPVRWGYCNHYSVFVSKGEGRVQVLLHRHADTASIKEAQYRLAQLALQIDGQRWCTVDPGRLQYTVTHHNWTDVGTARFDDAYFEIQFSGMQPWGISVSASDAPGGNPVLLPETEMIMVEGSDGYGC